MRRPRSGVRVSLPSNLVELMHHRALDDPERVAYRFLVDGEADAVTLTTRELERRARAIAAMLQEAAAAGDRALLLHEPGLDYIAAFFGCLYAGIIAVPAYPPDPTRLARSLPRLQAIVADAGASVALTGASILALAESLFAYAPDLRALTWLPVDDITTEKGGSRWQEPPLSPDTIAFLQYTSGSTGTPKGVMVSHGNLMHNLARIKDVLNVTPATVGVSWLPPYHDMGLVAMILTPMYAGCTAVLMSPLAFLERPVRWLQAISRYRGTICGAPNFAYDLCVKRIPPDDRLNLDLTSWRSAGCAAEPVRAATLNRFAAAFAPCGFRPETFFPCYGLAEATLIAAGGKIDESPIVLSVQRAALAGDRAVAATEGGADACTLVGSGTALPGHRLVIADPHSMTQCPADRAGEVWLAGPSVARGYWNRPTESEKAFKAVLADTGEGPFLRTGDLGFLRDGELFITGRLKDLIIVRGTNYYAEDIELTAQESNGMLRRGCGAAFPIEVDGEERLALVQEVDTRRQPDWQAAIGDIRQALSEHHDVAIHTVVLVKPGSIHKTSSGKIQRYACRSQFLVDGFDAVAEWRANMAKLDPLPRRRQAMEEDLVLELAAELDRDPSEIDVNVAITRHGLDSLGAFALAQRIEATTGVVLRAVSLLEGTSIVQLASRLVDHPARPSPRSSQVRAPVHATAGEYPLSRGQAALWFLHKLAPESTAYDIAQAVRIRGGLDSGALRRAFQQLVDRHAILRTTFVDQAGRPVQRVAEHGEVRFDERDATGWSQRRLDEQLNAEAWRPFDLERGPLLRVSVFTRADDDHVVVLALHHIVADLWSLTVLARELGILYAAAQRREEAPLPPPQHQYAEYVGWQEAVLSSPDGNRLRAHWERKLGRHLPVTDLPTDRPRPPIQTFRGAAHPQRLGTKLTERITELGQAQGATLYTCLLAAFQVLLHRHTGQDDILVGSPTAGRTKSEWADVVGYFVNPVVLRADFAEDPTFEVFLARVRSTVIDALEHGDYPFASLVEKLRPARDAGRSPLFQVMFILQNTAQLGGSDLASFALGHPGVGVDVGELHLESHPLQHDAAQLDLTLMMAEVGGELRATWQYNTDLFDAATIVRMAGHFETLLDGIVACPTERVSRLPILNAAERQELLVEWNATCKVFAGPRCIHQLFEDQARRTPDAVATVSEGCALTYWELNRRANQLAHSLQHLGVGPEVPVGICVQRSPEMLVGLLAIFKAGGAYVPLDPDYPEARLAMMLDDAQPPVILTQEPLTETLPQSPATVVRLDADWQMIANESPEDLTGGVIAQNLAYIIYTSGSTGRPKGVMNTHRAVCNYLYWLQDTFELTASDRLLQATPLSFDISVTECFWPLSTGASLTLASPGGHRDAAHLVDLIATREITVLQVVPSALRLILDEPRFDDCTRVRLVLCGGEALTVELNELFSSRSSAAFYNLYGPTEASVWATYWKCRPGSGSIPIGRPISNTRVYLLSHRQQPVPIGTPGELHIGGEGVARGYLNRPELTAEKFIPDPFDPEGDQRLYKTGDLARYRPDGTIELLGRLDHQLKIRGYRIEPGEIEAILRSHPEVRESVVVARADGDGDTRLVAYVVPRWEQPPREHELRAFLKKELPGHLVPSAFVMMSALPITSNGKLDRQALPEPGRLRPDQDVLYVAPRTAEEDRLCELWSQVLGLDLIGIHDDFFELGGDSLRAAQLAARMSVATRRDVPVKLVLKNRSVAAAAAALRELAPSDETPRRQRREPAVGAGRLPEARSAAWSGTRFDSRNLKVERRSLLSLFAAGKIAPVQAAAVAYLPTALPERAGVSRGDVIDGWCENLPVFSSVHDTSLGRIATLILPRFADELYADREGLVPDLVEALQIAGRLGARTVSLTGLLPSATDYGRDLAEAARGMRLPRITTGHATTAATVVLAIKKLLAATGRDLARERVGFLGLGSIGAATLRAMLGALPHPAEILLCDVAARGGHLHAIQHEIVSRKGYCGGLRVAESGSDTPDALYEATLIIGATNVPDVLDIDRLQPGTMIVDDSDPHCFNAERAIQRLRAERDILFTEGGVLRAPKPFHQLRYVPRFLDSVLDPTLLRAFEPTDPHEIPGCVFSSTLSTSVEHLVPTIGVADGKTCLDHYRVLEDLRFEAGTLRCEAEVVPEECLRAFRIRFGSSTA